MKRISSKLFLSLGLLMLLPNLASAHIVPGTGHGFVDGVLHPLTGWDHLLAMFAVGLWAAQQRGRAIWMIPLAFVSVMVLGGVMGLAGAVMPGVELGIGLSVLALGGLIATQMRFTPSLSMAIVGSFALFHGYAHGHEMPAAVGALPFSLGFVAATIALHGLGIGAGLTLQKRPQTIRFAGLAIALCSICFLVR